MKTIEIRRASLRVKPEKKLSKQGVKLARALAPYLGGPYHAYYASTAKRSRETLRALGFPTCHKVKAFAPLPDVFDRFERDLLAWQRHTGGSSLQGYLAIPEARERLEALGRRCLDEVLAIAKKLQPGGRALVVSHSAVIEALGMAAHPETDPSYVSDELRHLEGVALDIVDGVVSQLRILRLPQEVVAGLVTHSSTPPETKS